jgi:hypothetical protein
MAHDGDNIVGNTKLRSKKSTEEEMGMGKVSFEMKKREGMR